MHTSIRPMKRMRAPARRLLGTSVTGVVLLGALATAAPAHASTPLSTYDLYAYTSQISVGNTVTSNATFPSGIGCTTNSGLTRSNGGAVNLPLVTLGASTNTNATSGLGNVQTGDSVNQIAGLNLLGLVTADALTTSATATSAANGTITSAGSFSVVNLKVGLSTFNGAIAPNTTINLLGLGSLTLNKQIPVPGNAGLVTIGVDLKITLGANAGTEIQVGYAQSFFRAPQSTLVNGLAYSNLISAGPLLSVGPLQTQAVPCLGGTATSTLAGINLPGILTTGALTETGTATIGATTASGSTTSTTAGINLLSGLVTASAITAKANVAVNGGVTTVNGTGTVVSGLKIGGITYTGPTTPNTIVPLPGVGALIINRQIVTATSIEVHALEIVIFVPQVITGGTLPFGADIQVAGANISASPSGLGAAAMARGTQSRILDSLVKKTAGQKRAVHALAS